MKVKELIEQLKDCPQNWEIILSSDEEGNCYLKIGEIVQLDAEKSIVLYPSHEMVNI